mmetsp:Transcript_29740/g.79131  ORF Transcript_29740/g.79131 Transcript_29740/m.79131 type:complete len:265 (-) Transcript_29740:760-1554(-)
MCGRPHSLLRRSPAWRCAARPLPRLLRKRRPATRCALRLGKRGAGRRTVPEDLPHLLESMGKKPGVHDHAPQRREEGQQNHRGVACGQPRRGVVRLQGLVALACMSVMVRMPLELEHHVVRHAARRVPRVLRLHLLVLPRLQLAALQPVVLQVIHTLKQEHRHQALRHKERHGLRAGQARQRKSDARRHQEVDRDLVVPPREALPPQPCGLDAARVHKLALHHPRQELVEALAVARGCRVVISRDVLVMPQGVLHVEVAVGGRA